MWESMDTYLWFFCERAFARSPLLCTIFHFNYLFLNIFWSWLGYNYFSWESEIFWNIIN
jgi:hypothetical protein